ncbi:TIGR01906 family membrane protein [Arthrobacter sp. KK5.5]|uniref:TIGR01906 family membrane protein n=1 Tax=Arthrobacter sp. KK5.5 TaxID=3373084 RepID=UPI003EE5E31E
MTDNDTRREPPESALPETVRPPDGAPPASEPTTLETAAEAGVAAPAPRDGGNRRASAAESEEVRKMDRAAAVAAAKRPAAGSGPKPELDPGAQRRNAAREAALSAKPVLPRVLQVALAVAFPFLLVIGAIKAVASPWFLWLEYNRPGFPDDQFGFTAGERLIYGSYGVDYLNNAAGPDYLGGLVESGGNALFLASEVAHMADVKAVVAGSFLAGLILLAAVALIVFYLGRKYAGGVRRGLFAGSVATVVVMVAVGLLAAIDWQAFFAGFHRVFFADGTWTFRFSDTLIRLFPPQFWIDAGIAVAALVLVGALATLAATWPTPRRRERSRLRQEARDFGLG